MARIEAICLGHKEEIKDNYRTVDELKEAVFVKFQKYLVQQNVNKTRVSFILTYTNKENQEELLENLNVINQQNAKWFRIFVKRVWESCCACLSPFGITPGQIPCECQHLECGYQYCTDCAQLMGNLAKEEKGIYCMYCVNSFPESPKKNQFLEDLLWKRYTNKYGVELLPTKNIMPGTLLNDIECRIVHIESLIQALKNKFNTINSIPSSIALEIERGDRLVEVLKKLKISIRRLLSTNNDDIDNKLNEYLTIYKNELTGVGDGKRKFQHFINICEQLLYYIKKAEFEKYFPSLNRKMNEWKNSLTTNKQFQPQIIRVFEAMEDDLNRNIIPSVPCKIGFIGNISAGKTSLLNRLRGVQVTNIDDDSSQEETTTNKIITSPMRVGKSTYCRLEFEHKFDENNQVILVDIEGSTDTDSYLKSSNYIDEIRKADCDLYIIVFDHQFTDIQQQWRDYIVNQLHRECWLVRNKADDLFIKLYKEDVGKDFNSSSITEKEKYGEKLIERIRQLVKFDIHGNELSDVYLTSVSYDVTNQIEILSKMSYSQFDLDKLLQKIRNLPISLHANRLQRMTVLAMSQVINNCFRRGYVVNVMKYKIAAGIAAVVPLGELIPRYCGREAIRQAFGVNNRSRFMNWWTGETNEFQTYLKEFDIGVYRSDFKTSVFNDTFRMNSTDTLNRGKDVSSILTKGATTAGAVGVAVSDDVIRAGGLGVVSATRIVSWSLFGVGIALTAVLCAWAAVSNGKQMYQYLNNLCDDLIIAGDYVTKNMIENNNRIRESFLSTQEVNPSSSINEIN